AASPKQLAELQTWLRSPSLPSGLAQRARIITFAADGVANSEIAELLGCSRQTVITWRQRFTRSGIAGLTDRPRAGPPPTIHVHKELESDALPPPPPPPSMCTRNWRSSPSPSPARRRPRARPIGRPGRWPASWA